MKWAVGRRIAVVSAAVGLAYVPNNPIVKAEAVLGLSPAPLERYLGIKNMFSGMTEGMHQLAHGELNLAMNANALTPVVACAFFAWALTGVCIRLQTRREECVAAALFVAMSALVNILHPVR